MMKNFIPLGQAGSYLNVLFIDKEHSYIDTKINKAVITDVYGTRFLVNPILVKGKLELPIKENK